METHKPLFKDAYGEDVNEHLYRSRVCACARFQVNPKSSHLHVVKRIFRYLKGARLDRKSTIGGCQFLWCRLISWQCKKQIVVANSITEAESRTVYSDLSPEDKERYNADIRAMNILLQGLPKDIYSLINHYTDAKDIQDNVKMLLEGSELTKEEDVIPQCMVTLKLFSQNKGETFNDYFVLVGGLCIKLINDMRNLKMTMSRMQLNSKFVNNMLPEWGRFVTTGNKQKD
ncbi:hypothetical protein Tco_0988214 [Tanacetum coccineum]|uniref:Uncharacterized protein n=1 Tax=Tanacetum coccineum TaxID=301880 RepID=A0ABQ5ER77_9ASTR